MTATRAKLGLLAASIAVLAAPSAAAAASLVPPGNSAAAQYTEAFPTAGGRQQAGHGQKGQRPSPAKALGAHNARQLEAQGPQGRAAAEVAAATAPSPSAQTSQPGPAGHEATLDRGGDGSNSAAGTSHVDQTVRAAGNPHIRLEETSGSSGLGEVVGQATGFSSSGQDGRLLLPLIVLGTIACSVAILWRRKRQVS